VSFLLAFPPETYSPPFVLHTCTSHPTWLNRSNFTWRRVQVMKPPLQTPVTSSLLGPNIFLSSLFSNIVSSPLISKIKFQIHTELREKCCFVNYNFYVLTEQARGKNALDWNVASFTRIQSPLNFLPNQILICCPIPETLNLWLVFKGFLRIFTTWFYPAFS
jgi:hypothetical protein